MRQHPNPAAYQGKLLEYKEVEGEKKLVKVKYSAYRTLADYNSRLRMEIERLKSLLFLSLAIGAVLLVLTIISCVVIMTIAFK